MLHRNAARAAPRGEQVLFARIAITSPSIAPETEPDLPLVRLARQRDADARVRLRLGGPELEVQIDRAAAIAAHEFASARKRRARR